MTTFTGTIGDDTALAGLSPILVGFTGGTIADLTDVVGDTFFGLPGDDTVSAGTGDDTIDGSDGDDTLSGNAGDDVFIGGAGVDTLDGGDGIDTASYAGSAAGVTIFLDGTAGSGGEGQGDTLSNIEDLNGSSLNDVLIGNDDANILLAFVGDDELGGGRGDDTLFGGDGADILVGGTGADIIDGGSGIDIAFYRFSSAGVTINLVTGNGFGGEAAGDTLRAVETVIASEFDDTIWGDLGENILIGRDGNDFFYGSSADDIFIGGNSAMSDAGTDTVSYFGGSYGLEGSYGVAVNLLNNSARSIYYDDELFGIENVIGTNRNDLLRGDDNANTLSGGVDGDTLLGQGGNDRLIGGSGRNVMTGGDGDDDFIFANGERHSIITDFDLSGDDRLLFSGFGTGFDFADFKLTVVNGSDVQVLAVNTSVGWSVEVYLQNAAGLVDASDFFFV